MAEIGQILSKFIWKFIYKIFRISVLSKCMNVKSPICNIVPGAIIPFHNFWWISANLKHCAIEQTATGHSTLLVQGAVRVAGLCKPKYYSLMAYHPHHHMTPVLKALYFLSNS